MFQMFALFLLNPIWLKATCLSAHFMLFFLLCAILLLTGFACNPSLFPRCVFFSPVYHDSLSEHVLCWQRTGLSLSSSFLPGAFIYVKRYTLKSGFSQVKTTMTTYIYIVLFNIPTDTLLSHNEPESNKTQVSRV